MNRIEKRLGIVLRYDIHHLHVSKMSKKWSWLLG